MKASLLISLCTFTSFFVFAQNDVKKNQVKQTILFVCEHGAGRSAIAASYFNKKAEKQGLIYRAIFRGIDPQEALGASTKNGLIKDSVDVTSLIPIKLSKNDIAKAYKLITLDCTLPSTFNKADTHWTGIEMNGNYEVSKKQIALKVDSLLTQLSMSTGRH
jgi:arsenate reductase (thioredoxin)